MSNDFIKDHYDREVPSLSGGSYEQYRWFKNPLQAAHFTLTKNTIKEQLLDTLPAVKNILEIGPGPGTWTELLLKQYPSASFTLVDISAQMLSEAKEHLASRGDFNFVNQDFTVFKSTVPMDLVFSSRAFEYVDDKKSFIANLAQTLSLGGVGFVITKTPHYRRDRWLGRKIPVRHTRQLDLKSMTKLLQEAGLVVLGVYPVTVSVPFLNSPKLNLLAAHWLKFLPLNFITLSLTESYAVKFAKQEIVELFGLPGSGKSTYARELEAEGYQRIKIRTRHQLIKYNWQFLVMRPKQFMMGLYYVCRYAGRPRWWYYKLMNLFFQHNAKYAAAAAYPRAVLDQGHFQNLLSLFDRPVEASIIKKYARYLPVPSELIIFDLDPTERQKRLKRRPRQPREELGIDRTSWLVAAEANFLTVKKEINELNLSHYRFYR